MRPKLATAAVRKFALTSAALLFVLGIITGCASSGGAQSTSSNGEPEASTSHQMQGAAQEAARQPLRDIGLMKRKIPYALSRIADPYAEPSGPGCIWLRYEISQLNAALGSEVAVMPVASRDSMAERGGRLARKRLGEMIRSAGSGLLPGRSVIRTISGASTADELYAAAQERGKVRRGYLKGLSEAGNCGT